ncbi:hypothetical protein DEO72_LG2g3726 [Vigna unguiculata]|uniref:Uncharacterized protein n=1 Tax=Vigna unguiculata TaxID=3917 RepID=A0A4D6L4C8_VIGUN|nr:hypothetical protein DEO72_LG2g3726 [Vigna unguiculata]
MLLLRASPRTPFVPASPPLHRGGGGFVAVATASFHQRRCCAVLPAPLLRRFANAIVAPFRQHRCAATSLRRGIRVPCLFFMALFRVVVAADVPWARSIQELGRKKFEKLRIGFERSQMEQKSKQKARSNYLVKKQSKKPLVRTSLEPVGSDFCSGATLATIAEENSNFSFFF